ncbi:Uncharacterised protein [Streptococcus pneumoniae]|nr:Uncharacterised protein [Streptococcus pneumoniae]
MEEITYENLTRRINRISAEMQEIGEKMGFIVFRLEKFEEAMQ